MQTENFNINVYSLLYADKSKRTRPDQMSFVTLHEVDKPDGVFIIIESNAELRAPMTPFGPNRTILEVVQSDDSFIDIEN